MGGYTTLQKSRSLPCMGVVTITVTYICSTYSWYVEALCLLRLLSPLVHNYTNAAILGAVASLDVIT